MKHWLLALLCIGAVPALAEPEPDPPDAEPVESAPEPAGPALSLDSLLSPRAGEWEKKATLRGGRDRETWRREFGDARAEVAQLQGQVNAVQAQLREASAGANWSYAPQGAGEAVDPEIMKLRAHLRRDRASLDAARARLRDLEVEASLAEVPDHWIERAPAPAP